MSHFGFGAPYMLVLLATVPLLLLWAWVARKQRRGLPLAGAALSLGRGSRWATWAGPLVAGLKFVALICLGIALSRPLGGRTWVDEDVRGVDIVLALDISGSMRAEDFQPVNRLVAAKQVLDRFLARSEGHRVALVAFAGRALTLAPLTTDLDAVREALKRVDFGTVRQDGTAIGDAIGTSLLRLADPKTKARVVVLFTDGENNAGYLDPIKSAAMAKVRGVRVHTVAVGRPGGAPIPMENALGQKVYLRGSDGQLILPQINEEALKRIADITGGRYFRATDNRLLEEAYEQINKLEKTAFEAKKHVVVEERFAPWALGALFAFLLAMILELGALRVLRAS